MQHYQSPEAFLGRAPIILDPHNAIQEVKGCNILITGAAGTIGSGLATQICACTPSRLVLIDQAETPLHDLDLSLREQFPDIDLQTHVANITDAARMNQLLTQGRIDTLFHAAAYKHVPFMERQPYEAMKTNILGTQILADLAISCGVKKFVFISTDKAIRPASVMGATKRFAELYLQYLNAHYPDETRFIITRFGNVLGSNGSFLPRFAQQIRAGGPVTVTHPEAERYLMTVHEACQLVLEAAAVSDGAEVLSFDMGQPVRIADIATKMIAARKDIHIVYTGLRPGEKLSEEPALEVLPRQAYLRSAPFEHPGCGMRGWLSALQEALDSGQPDRMVAVLKAAIPEYISANSPFTKLDVAACMA